MRIAIIGRTESLYEAAERLHAKGHQIGLIVTAREAPEHVKTAKDFESLASKHRVPFIHTPRIAEALEDLRALPPMDIGVSFNYVGVIPQSVIDCFRLGILNAHGGDLPRYRGNACQAWAILNGENHVGLCIHRMIGGELDSGDIVARDCYPLTLETKVTEVWTWMEARIPQLFEQALSVLERDPLFTLERQSKDPKDALRCYPRRPEDGRIEWRKDAVSIIRLVNACNKPYAGAFCEFEGEKLIIWDACLVQDDEIFVAVPGQVTRIGAGFVDVATGSGKIRLLRLENGGVMIAPDLLIKSLRKRLS